MIFFFFFLEGLFSTFRNSTFRHYFLNLFCCFSQSSQMFPLFRTIFLFYNFYVREMLPLIILSGLLLLLVTSLRNVSVVSHYCYNCIYTFYCNFTLVTHFSTLSTVRNSARHSFLKFYFSLTPLPRPDYFYQFLDCSSLLFQILFSTI